MNLKTFQNQEYCARRIFLSRTAMAIFENQAQAFERGYVDAN
jgi:hypothetical protein